jgi:biopolymer transport protein ExbD
MKRRSKPEPTSINPNVTPLIDVVMCLVIFFMLVAKIGVSTGAEQMSLPASILGADIKDMGNTLTLNVHIGPGDQPIVKALIKDHEEELKIIDAEGRHPLAEALALFRFGPDHKRGTADDNPNFSIILRAEADLPYKYIEPILMACAEASVKNVNFNTRKADEVAQ